MHVWGVFYHAKLDNYTHRHLCALKLSASSPILFFRTESWCRAKPGCFSRFVPVLFVVHRHYDPVMNQSLLQFAKYSKKRCISSANLPLAVHAIDTRQSDWFRSWEPEDYWGSCCFSGMVLRQWFHLIQRHENGGCYNRETTGKKTVTSGEKTSAATDVSAIWAPCKRWCGRVLDHSSRFTRCRTQSDAKAGLRWCWWAEFLYPSLLFYVFHAHLPDHFQ